MVLIPRSPLSKRDNRLLRKAIVRMFVVIKEALLRGEKVVIPNFGRFDVVERTYGSVLSGEYLQYHRRRVRFTPAQKFRKSIQVEEENGKS